MAASTIQTDVPLNQSPIADVNGNITEPWFLFLIQLWRRTGGTGGGGTGIITLDDVFGSETTYSDVLSNPSINLVNNEVINSITTEQSNKESEVIYPSISLSNSLDEMVMAEVKSTDYSQAASTVTIGSSPATYTATSRQGVHVTGGSVSSITINRNSTSLNIGNSSSDMVDNMFEAGTDFVPGVTTSLTLTESFGSIPRLWVFFDSEFQGDDSIASLVGTTLTFTSAIPLGISKIYVKGLLETAIGIGTVLVEMSIGDSINITYTSAPTLTILPR